MDEALKTCVLVCTRPIGVTTRRNCFITSVEFNNTVCCNLIGSDRFLLAHSGKYAHRKNTAGLRDYVWMWHNGRTCFRQNRTPCRELQHGRFLGIIRRGLPLSFTLARLSGPFPINPEAHSLDTCGSLVLRPSLLRAHNLPERKAEGGSRVRTISELEPGNARCVKMGGVQAVLKTTRMRIL